MANAVTNRKAVYPLAECIEASIDATNTSSLDLMDIPKGAIIEKVLVRITSAGVGTGNIVIGDDANSAGYVAAGDATGAAGTIYGDATSEIGTYLAADTVTSYVYSTAGSELKAKITAATLTTGVSFQTIVIGKRFAI